MSFPPRIPWSGLIDKYGVNSGGNPGKHSCLPLPAGRQGQAGDSGLRRELSRTVKPGMTNKLAFN